MRILHVIDSGGLYGAEIMLLQLMAEQVRLGHEPVLASIGSPASGEKAIEVEARRQGLKVIPFRMKNGPNWVGAFKLLCFARREGVELIHSHGYKGNILFGLMPRALRRLPLVATLHGYTSNGRLGRMLVYEWLDRLSLRRLERVVLVNPLMAQLPALRRLPNTAVIANGINPAVAAGVELDTSILAFLHRAPTVVAVGRLSPEKGFDLLLRSVAVLRAEGRPLQVLLLGDGGLRDSLLTLGKELALEDSLLLPGYVRNVSAYLPHCSLLAMPSLTEGLPMALLEAMTAGVPVAASSVGGIPAALADGRAGLLVAPGNVEQLSQAIRLVLDQPLVAAQRALVAADRVRQHYSSRTMTQKYLVLYQQLMPRPIQTLRAVEK